MLDVGFSEILLTSAIALIVLGPERLPKVARQVGNWMGRARAMARQLSEQLEREVSAEELLKAQSKPSPGANPPDGGTNPQAGIEQSPTVQSPDGVANSSGGSTNGAGPDHAYTIAPPAAEPPRASTPEPVYGRDASLTTPAAMHASDPPAADQNLAEAHAAATDAKSPP